MWGVGVEAIFFFFFLNNLLLLLFALELHSTSSCLLGSISNKRINMNFPARCRTQTLIPPHKIVWNCSSEIVYRYFKVRRL